MKNSLSKERMSCSINRYKFTGTAKVNSGAETGAATEAAKEMEARMKEMLAVRAAQDGGNFKARPSWDPASPTQPFATPHEAAPQ